VVKFKNSSVIYLQASAGKLVDNTFSGSHENLTDLASSNTVALSRLCFSLFSFWNQSLFWSPLL